MRRTTWYPAKLGDKRTSSWFAFWPVQLGNDRRWLEVVTVEWEYQMVHPTFALPPAFPVPRWVKIRFTEHPHR